MEKRDLIPAQGPEKTTKGSLGPQKDNGKIIRGHGREKIVIDHDHPKIARGRQKIVVNHPKIVEIAKKIVIGHQKIIAGRQKIIAGHQKIMGGYLVPGNMLVLAKKNVKYYECFKDIVVC